MSQRIISVDSQIVNSIQSCARKTYYSHELNLQTIEKAEPLERGDLLHKMLEVYYGIKGKCARVDSELWQVVIEAIPDAHPDNFVGDPVQIAIDIGQFFASKMTLPLEEVEEIIYQFREYCNYYANDPWKPLAVEEVGSKMIYEDEEIKIVYNFKIDLIGEQGKIIAPFDHKSSKRRGDPSSLSNQFIGYAFGIDSSHVVVNKIGFQKTLKPAERFQRIILTIDESRKKEWLENTIWWCKMLDFHKQANNWPMNLTSCDKYSGCVFANLCESSPEARDWKIERDYKVGEKWDVAHVLEAK